ncbi:hypothetical protein [Enterovirga aerilata]|uniref:Uncharacterized protein n=1 Tax=Enterovirga aerilata TaxID=2730920 RepID=A0A849IDG2_9HYPH|nr:hypothetical protein [Enterovirga sp. DB1703]NNM74469.1 hypothetical protein [Enterovirga sp. DB1703]
MSIEPNDAPLRPDEMPEGGSRLSRLMIVSAVVTGTFLVYMVISAVI